MKIERVETLACDAGWRNYNFLKITSDTGLVGWSEYDEAYGPPGLTDIVQRLGRRIVGSPVGDHERACGLLAASVRPAPYGLTAEAIGAIENALLDLKAKSLGIPCYELLGGKHRDAVPIYWSHCTTWRVTHPTHYPPAVVTLDDVKQAGVEVRNSGIAAAKTNLFLHDGGRARQWYAGFGVPYRPDLNVDRNLIRNVRAHLEALRDGLGPDVELLIDMNFNFRTEGYVRLLRELADFDLFWCELDSYNPEAVAYIRQRSHAPISALETLFGVRQYLPYFQAQAVDVAIVDAVWNGVWQSMKIAATADAFDVNVAAHNYYSYLGAMISVHFAAAVPNLRIIEHDVDRIAWDNDLFSSAPVIENGAIRLPDAPGWGCDPIEAALAEHPAKDRSTFLGL